MISFKAACHVPRKPLQRYPSLIGRIVGLAFVAVYCAACAAGPTSLPSATAPALPSATAMLFPTLPPSHTPTATFTPTVTQPATATLPPTATATLTATPQPTQSPVPTTAVAPTQPVPLGGSDQILYVSNRTGRNQLYVMSIDGRDQGAVLPSKEAQIDPAWSPDRSQIAFAGGNASFHIFILDIETRTVTQLTAGDGSETDPVWSPRGDQIAYIHTTLQDNQPVTELRIADLEEGTNRLVVTGLTPQAQLCRATWSSDGRRLAFAAQANGQSEIHVINADGTNETNLTPEGPSYNPDWSPDGRTIAFVSGRTGQTQIYTMDPDGGNLQLLTDRALESILTVAWSPNGKRLVFNAGFSNESDLYIVGADGIELFRLLEQPFADHAPDW